MIEELLSHTDPVQTFADLGLRPELVAVLTRHGIDHPFPIQAASLPDSLAGRNVLGRGRTGSGKTVAFALPVVTRLLEAGRRPRPGKPGALILVPTRELAVQVNETLAFLARAVGLKTMTIYGGVSYIPQLRKLEMGVDVVIATPGRLEDLIAQGRCDLSEVDITVLDEADLMADMGFLPPVMRLLDAMPATGQRMLFSATLDNDVDSLVRKYLKHPVTHSVDPVGSEPQIDHRLLLVTRDNKHAVLADLVQGEGRTLVFSRTKHGAARLAQELTNAGVPATELHGSLSQAVRQRNLNEFSNGGVRVLVATDIAARGIHVDDITLVIHADPPAEHKAFLHRSGRTARAGASGTVVTLCLREQNRLVKELMRKARITPTQSVVTPGDDTIVGIRGEIAAPPVRRPELKHFVPAHPKPSRSSHRPTHAGSRPRQDDRRGSMEGRASDERRPVVEGRSTRGPRPTEGTQSAWGRPPRRDGSVGGGPGRRPRQGR
ncbi:MAG: DEAD/DEAH box helicase [Micropruina sp.]|nr:DEAD/DEAH box helicase [Micropruina sp.]